jgi:REP element-mobilizing transposase RayT
MWLQEEGVAEIVKEAIHFRDGKEYELVAYTIMPNHVHLVFRPIVGDINVAIQNVSGDLSRENNNIPTDQIVGDINVAIQKPNYLVTDILRKLKGSTARDCNKLLKRTGAFWHHESYDHVVRNIEELRRIVNYVLLNPVKAGLVDDYEKWKWSYYNPKYLM